MVLPREERVRLLAMLAKLPGDGEAASRALPTGEPGGRLLAYAQRHGLLPFLACHLGAHAPAALRASLREVEETRALSHAVGLHGVAIASRALLSAGVLALSLKGPLLGARLYDPPFSRPSLDLDFLVLRSDLQAARTALRSAGWTDSSADAAASALSVARHHHVQLLSTTLPALELHFAATSSFGASIPAEKLFAEARDFPLEDLIVRVPGELDEIVYLAVHAGAHHVERLGWLFDLALLLRRRPNLEQVLQRAEELHVRRVVHALLAFAASTFDVPAELPPLDRLQRAALATVPLFDRPAISESARSGSRVAFVAALADSPARSGRYLANKIALRRGRGARIG